MPKSEGSFDPSKYRHSTEPVTVSDLPAEVQGDYKTPKDGRGFVEKGAMDRVGVAHMMADKEKEKREKMPEAMAEAEADATEKVAAAEERLAAAQKAVKVAQAGLNKIKGKEFLTTVVGEEKRKKRKEVLDQARWASESVENEAGRYEIVRNFLEKYKPAIIQKCHSENGDCINGVNPEKEDEWKHYQAAADSIMAEDGLVGKSSIIYGCDQLDFFVQDGEVVRTMPLGEPSIREMMINYEKDGTVPSKEEND